MERNVLGEGPGGGDNLDRQIDECKRVTARGGVDKRDLQEMFSRGHMNTEMQT